MDGARAATAKRRGRRHRGRAAVRRRGAHRRGRRPARARGARPSWVGCGVPASRRRGRVCGCVRGTSQRAAVFWQSKVLGEERVRMRSPPAGPAPRARVAGTAAHDATVGGLSAPWRRSAERTCEDALSLSLSRDGSTPWRPCRRAVRDEVAGQKKTRAVVETRARAYRRELVVIGGASSGALGRAEPLHAAREVSLGGAVTMLLLGRGEAHRSTVS